MVAATLRPETMYCGPFSCLARTHPFSYEGTAKQTASLGQRSSMAYLLSLTKKRSCVQLMPRATCQDTFTPRNQVNQLVEVRGADLIGTKIKAPFAIHPEVYVLPMESVLQQRYTAFTLTNIHSYALIPQGIGLVTSVPSDSPDDLQTLVDLRKKPRFYNIDPAGVSIDPVPVLRTPTYGNMTAPTLVETLKILSQKDKIQLAEAKEIAYKEGFYNGTMIVGEFSGERVRDAKPKVRESMIKQGVAFAYAEPDGLVVSRSGGGTIGSMVFGLW